MIARVVATVAALAVMAAPLVAAVAVYVLVLVDLAGQMAAGF